MDSSTEDLSDAGVFRHMPRGQTVTQPSDGSNDLLLHQPFIGSKSQQLLGEVSPREQDEDKEMVQEMVVTPLSEQSSCSEDIGSHVTEESQDSTDSRLVPNSGYNSEENSHDKLRSVSREWVLNEIQKAKDGSEQKKMKQKLDKLSQQVSELTVRFDRTEEQLQSKQKELDQCQKELKTYKKEVRELTKKLEHEVSTRSELESKLKMSTEQVKQREDMVEQLEVVVKRLQKELKKEKQNNSMTEAVGEMVRNNTDLIQELRQIPDPDPLSPTECEFRFVSGEAQSPIPDHDRTLRFMPDSPTGPPSHAQLKHQNSVD